ncbi:ACT domain-containing protein [Paludicola sp. MB14-C6]|uniref:ACT domain-containing protein n=1 Tax=Paludihabitans sp. MB14-C6 TaxID=3070656 RepID=UPI0027DD586D|nr:ACT domain-containing protein [Paludicola sp. MB14-C6]WMJ23060.1 ACT domain-containing protein [Paludicola sp. MB14-C6]
MKVISQVSMTENVAVVTLENAPANIQFLSHIFDVTAKAGINVDMISQTAPKGTHNTISFTVIDTKVPDLLKVVNQLHLEVHDIKPLVSVGNVKICLFGEEMPSKVGVASDVFNRLNEEKIDILLITTSDVDISIVVQSADSERAYTILKAAYEG